MATDRLIDDVARGLTSVEPSAHLRERVMLAVENRPRAFRWGRAVSATLVATASVAVVGAAVVWHGQVPVRRAQEIVPAVSRAEDPPAAVPPSPSVPAISTPSSGSGRPIETAPLSAEERAWQVRAVMALDSPDVLPLAGGQPAATVTPLVEVAPLVMDALTVAPLDNGEHLTSGGA